MLSDDKNRGIPGASGWFYMTLFPAVLELESGAQLFFLQEGATDQPNQMCQWSKLILGCCALQ